jgi:S-formylglutathione hydrolase FrmB
LRRTLTFLLTVGLLGLLPASAARTAAATTGPEPVDARWLGPRTVDLTFEVPGLSSVLPRPKVRVLLPRGYRSSARRYPVLLLLHGAGDRYDGWTTNQDGWPVTLRQFTADKDVIVVMPDGGTPDRPGWYSDWFNFGELGSPRWETFHIKTVLPYIFRTFRAERDRDSHVVAGLSMGGFGAMSYAARHPDLFAGAFSLSGALDNRRFMSHVFPEVWGTEADQLVRVRGHNPVDLAGNLRHTRLWFRTGQGVPGGPAPRDNEPQGLALEQGVGKLNEIFAAALERAGLPYTYQSYAQGGHNWWHWQRGLQRLAWPEIEAVFAHDGPDRPRRFSYRSIEPRFRVWGWRVRADREVVEFLRMTGVRRQGLRLVGSGTVDLRTPAVYEPGRRYRIDVEGATATTPTPVVRADESGRLGFVVRLGDSHVYQQDTAPQRAAAAEPGAYWQAATVRISR